MNEVIEKEEIKIENMIYEIRGKQVMLDSDLAWLFDYETKNLNRQVQRNINRFPENYCFQINDKEYNSLRCQIGTLNIKQGQNIKYLPYAFTEYGIAMLSKRADGVEATIYTGKISKQLLLENTDAEELLGRM